MSPSFDNCYLKAKEPAVSSPSKKVKKCYWACWNQNTPDNFQLKRIMEFIAKDGVLKSIHCYSKHNSLEQKFYKSVLEELQVSLTASAQPSQNLGSDCKTSIISKQANILHESSICLLLSSRRLFWNVSFSEEAFPRSPFGGLPFRFTQRDLARGWECYFITVRVEKIPVRNWVKNVAQLWLVVSG